MAKRKIIKKKCIGKCGREQTIANFYTTKSPMFPDGKVPICKVCVKEMLTDESDVTQIRNILRHLDKPFIPEIWKKCMESEKETLGWYLREISTLHQHKNLTYANSIESEKDHIQLREPKLSIDDIDELETENGYIKVTDELKLKWGAGYTNKEYLDLEKFYQDMIFTHDISTPQHKKLLMMMCKLDVKMNQCIEEGKYGDFEKLARQNEAILKSAGFRPVDRASSNESAGIRTFSQIFEEVERDGFIEPYPIEEKPDIVDKTIMYILNYQRRLLNMEKLFTPPSDTPMQEEVDEDAE